MHSTSTLIVTVCSLAAVTADTRSTSPSSTPTTTSVDTATCTAQSIAACPATNDPCCAFICAEAQVPFDVCSPSNRTEFAVCSQCPNPVTTATSTSTATTTLTHTITTPPTMAFFSTSSCSGSLLSTAGCPANYEPCCACVCEEAQEPFDVCSQTDGSGELAMCSQCPRPTSGH